MVRRSLADAGIAAAPASGVMFMWVDLGEGLDSLDVAKRMLAKGYLTAPAKHFCPPNMKSSLMRFNVTTTIPSAIQVLGGSL
jgi:DNA-binding transcriptional MocR family regulator